MERAVNEVRVRSKTLLKYTYKRSSLREWISMKIALHLIFNEDEDQVQVESLKYFNFSSIIIQIINKNYSAAPSSSVKM